MAYDYVYSLNTDDFDAEYMQRTGVGDIVRTWTGRRGGCVECYIALKAA